MTHDYSTPEYWNKRAAERRSSPQKCLFNDNRFAEFQERTENILRALVKSKMYVLDVACGYGRFAKCVTEQGGIWHGIDFSVEMHALCEPQYQNSLVLGDATRPHEVLFDQVRFDLIFQVNSGKVLQMNAPQFAELYRPYLQSPGTLAVLECDEFIIFNKYERQEK